MPKSRSAAPIFAAVLLLLPVLYVGSYLALLQEIEIWTTPQGYIRRPAYRVRGAWIADFYWPSEQIDRKLRPGAWAPQFEFPPIDPGPD